MHAILHMGPPKTGTSAIQLGLLQNTDRLRRDGMLLSNTVGQQNGNSGILAANLIGPIANDPRPPTKDARPLFQDEVAAFTGDTIIISAEAFFNRLLNFGDNLSANARLDRMKPRLAHLLFELAQHGITSVSAVLVLRNEADRYVSGLVQRVQSMTTRPWQKMGDVPADELVQPIDRFIAALRAAQVDVVTIPYTDPDDARPLLDRFAGTALKIDTSTDWVPLADKVNVSLGVVGCVCGKTIAGLIETTYADDASAIQRACGWSKKQLRGAYSDIMQGEADAPFNLAGPERIKLIQDIQAPSLRALANELTAAQLEVLGRTKWLGVPKSPQSADELDPREQLLFTSILHRFVERVRAHSKTFDAVGERAVSAIQHFASTHTTVGATA